ncbi:STE3-domain-containing protein [Artomyces pyxidatus]|uniref:STE3-domain-containing protein n=1 Tax=Artomyces pyxidatus TaxID=48021 RepID=A0ACB8SXG8_9AGAM|nr:STE3-domain-containing protein [Artomyces pyxidatus]
MFRSALGCLDYMEGSTRNTAPVWCDIFSRVAIAVNVATPAATLCVIQELYTLTRITGGTILSKRPEFLINVTIAFGLPILQMSLACILQGHRFNIMYSCDYHFAAILSVGFCLFTCLRCHLYNSWPSCDVQLFAKLEAGDPQHIIPHGRTPQRPPPDIHPSNHQKSLLVHGMHLFKPSIFPRINPIYHRITSSTDLIGFRATVYTPWLVSCRTIMDWTGLMLI